MEGEAPGDPPEGELELSYKVDMLAKVDPSILWQIDRILCAHFAITPSKMISAWRKRDSERYLYQFFEMNEACFKYAQGKLGYAKGDLTREQKRIVSHTLPPSWTSYIPNILQVLFILLGVFGIVLSFLPMNVQEPDFMIAFNNFIESSPLLRFTTNLLSVVAFAIAAVLIIIVVGVIVLIARNALAARKRRNK